MELTFTKRETTSKSTLKLSLIKPSLNTSQLGWKHHILPHMTGDPDPKRQASLAKEQQLTYRSGVGELIWAMTTCRPDLAYTAVKLSQSNTAPDTIHYN
jgi:hypothetical protein